VFRVIGSVAFIQPMFLVFYSVHVSLDMCRTFIPHDLTSYCVVTSLSCSTASALGTFSQALTASLGNSTLFHHVSWLLSMEYRRCLLKSRGDAFPIKCVQDLPSLLLEVLLSSIRRLSKLLICEKVTHILTEYSRLR
jgi:hypothetical protein